MNEDSRGLGRHYKGRNFIPKSQDILYGRKHSKRRRNRQLRTRKRINALRTCCHAPWACKNAPMLLSIRLRHVVGASELLFPHFKWKIPNFSAQTHMKTLPIHTTPLVHYFSLRTKRFKRKASIRSFNEPLFYLLNYLI